MSLELFCERLFIMLSDVMTNLTLIALQTLSINIESVDRDSHSEGQSIFCSSSH